ncbi:MAG: glycosyltransferase [Gemmatimonadetes bacterium]|nr:glycosyltransferase [Gemmatimonadota bacterium]
MAAERGDLPGRVRVTHVVHDLHGGGMESLVAAMARRFAGTRIVMSAITLRGRPGNVGSSVRHLLDQYHVIKPIPGVSMAVPLGLVRRVRATRPDVVHIHSAWYKAALAAHLAGVERVIYTEHGREHDDPPLMRWLDRLAARWTDIVVPVSDRLNAYLRTELGVSPDRLRTIENGIDTDVFVPGETSPALRAKLGIPGGASVLGSIGRLEPVKAYERLIDAFATLRAEHRLERPLVLVICGHGSQREALEVHARTLGVADAVRLPGWVDTPAEFYRMLDVFALTSLSEGTSVSLLEAMACGIAPVVTNVGSNAALLGPELAEQVVPAGDREAFVRVAHATLASPERRAEVGRSARRRVVTRYSLDRFLAEYEELYVNGLAAAPASMASAS